MVLQSKVSPKTPQELPKLKFSKALEEDPHYLSLLSLLEKDRRPIWEKGTIAVSYVHFIPALGSALSEALRHRQLVMGLEMIDTTLDNEKKGLDAVHEKKSTTPSYRVSRLLIVANNGSERFYRSCERTALKHKERLLLIVTDIPAILLSAEVSREGREIKALLVSDKEAVSKVLLSLVQK